jgi:hypothetical protein
MASGKLSAVAVGSPGSDVITGALTEFVLPTE